MAQQVPVGRAGGIVGSISDGAAVLAEGVLRAVRRRANRLELRLVARRVARDPEARASLEDVRRRVADGSIQRELANQPDIWTLLKERRAEPSRGLDGSFPAGSERISRQ